MATSSCTRAGGFWSTNKDKMAQKMCEDVISECSSQLKMNHFEPIMLLGGCFYV